MEATRIYPCTGVDIPAALACLTQAGVTRTALTAAGIDVRDPAALRNEVRELLASVLAESSIADDNQVLALQAALELLYTDAERHEMDQLAERILARLTRVDEPHPDPDLGQVDDGGQPWYGQICLEDD